MTTKTKESDRETLRRIMSEPTFEAVAAAATREYEKRQAEMATFLRDAADAASLKAEGRPE